MELRKFSRPINIEKLSRTPEGIQYKRIFSFFFARLVNEEEFQKKKLFKKSVWEVSQYEWVR